MTAEFLGHAAGSTDRPCTVGSIRRALPPSYATASRLPWTMRTPPISATVAAVAQTAPADAGADKAAGAVRSGTAATYEIGGRSSRRWPGGSERESIGCGRPRTASIHTPGPTSLQKRRYHLRTPSSCSCCSTRGCRGSGVGEGSRRRRSRAVEDFPSSIPPDAASASPSPLPLWIRRYASRNATSAIWTVLSRTSGSECQCSMVSPFEDIPRHEVHQAVHLTMGHR